MRRALASTLHLDSMGFADPERDGRPLPPGPMAIGELDHGAVHVRARDSAGRYVSASDDTAPESRALRASRSDLRASRESGSNGTESR